MFLWVIGWYEDRVYLERGLESFLKPCWFRLLLASYVFIVEEHKIIELCGFFYGDVLCICAETSPILKATWSVFFRVAATCQVFLTIPFYYTAGEIWFLQGWWLQRVGSGDNTSIFTSLFWFWI